MSDKRKRAIRDLAEKRGISYTTAMRLHDAGDTTSSSTWTSRVWRGERAEDDLTFLVGHTRSGETHELVLRGEGAHLLIAGPPASGKTNIAMQIAAQTLMLEDDGEARGAVYVLDGAGAFARDGWGDAGAVLASASTEREEMLAGVQGLHRARLRLLRDDPQSAWGAFIPVIVVVDSIEAIIPPDEPPTAAMFHNARGRVQDDATGYFLRELLAEGRATCVSVVVTGQSWPRYVQSLTRTVVTSAGASPLPVGLSVDAPRAPRFTAWDSDGAAPVEFMPMVLQGHRPSGIPTPDTLTAREADAS